jgi:hypothetical protein
MFIYVIFINNHVTKAVYVYRLEKQIKEMEQHGDAENEQQDIGLKINSLEGKKLILQTLKEMKPNYSLNFFGPSGFIRDVQVTLGDISFKYGVQSYGYTIELDGVFHNFYELGSDYDLNQRFTKYLRDIIFPKEFFP